MVIFHFKLIKLHFKLPVCCYSVIRLRSDLHFWLHSRNNIPFIIIFPNNIPSIEKKKYVRKIDTTVVSLKYDSTSFSKLAPNFFFFH